MIRLKYGETKAPGLARPNRIAARVAVPWLASRLLCAMMKDHPPPEMAQQGDNNDRENNKPGQCYAANPTMILVFPGWHSQIPD
jgi:hypothetical protein